MKWNHLINKIWALICMAIITGLVSGCLEKDVYDPNYGKEPLPDPNGYFGFEMRTDVDLYVDYNTPGFKALIEVYDENPLVSGNNQREKKDGIEAVFKIYTDENGKYTGKMNIPTSVQKVYLYTETWGLPGCMELEVKDGAIHYDAHQTREQAPANRAIITRGTSFNGDVPYLIDSKRNLYSLCTWASYGDLLTNWNYVPINQGYISMVYTVEKEDMGAFLKRLKSMLFNGSETDNSKYVKGPETTNVYTTKKAELSVVFLNKDASYENTFGYYYYKGKDHANVDVNKIKKYIVFPRVTQDSGIDGNVLYSGYTAQLKFFGEDGNGKPQSEFPEGYTVGWFIYSDGYHYNYNANNNGEIAEVGTPIAAQKGGGYVSLITSNDSKRSYINVKDSQSGKLILGVEDGVNNSYVDLLFYVNSTPASAIEDPNRPSIDNPGSSDEPDEPTDVKEAASGTLAFEDIWPSGGDYDMNDVVVEYSRDTYFNEKNLVTKIVDTFKPVYDGATFKNAFAYQIDNGYVGKVTLPAGAIYEKETSSIIVFPNAKTVQKQSYQIIREFGAKEAFKKEDLLFHTYNPYIIVNYAEGEANRIEVHLPKHKATSMADQDKIGSKDDAYYIDRQGAYPFAIDIPILNFKTVAESHHIDSEYPNFSKWAESKGAKYTDWYNNAGGNK